jgi:hypothetical protein
VPDTAGVKVARSKLAGKVILIIPCVGIVVTVVKPMVTLLSAFEMRLAGTTLVDAKAKKNATPATSALTSASTPPAFVV